MNSLAEKSADSKRFDVLSGGRSIRNKGHRPILHRIAQIVPTSHVQRLLYDTAVDLSYQTGFMVQPAEQVVV